MSVQKTTVTEESKLKTTLKKFAKFMAASGISTLLDLTLFYVLQTWVVPRVWPEPVAVPPLIANLGIFCATVVARVCSATLNFMLNRNFVFKLKGQKNAIPKYILLSTAVMLISGIVVGKLINLLPEGTTAIVKTLVKAAVDTVIFVFNFFVQKTWVFPQKKEDQVS